MNWLQATDTIRAPESAKTVIRAMDRLNAQGHELTDENIAKEAEMTIAQVRNITFRFRRQFEDSESYVIRAKIIARKFGKKGRKLTG